MKPRILAGWMLALLALTTTETVAATQASPRMLALSITSDRLEMDDKNQVAIFSGHVVADDGRMRLTSEKMTVRYDKRMKGNGGVREVKAEGRVTIQQERDHGTADVALYQVDKRVVELIGNERDATVRRGDDQLTGKRILVTLNPQQRIDKVSVQGAENRRVSARITPSGVISQDGGPPRVEKSPASKETGGAESHPASGPAMAREKITLPAPGQPVAPAGEKNATGEGRGQTMPAAPVPAASREEGDPRPNRLPASAATTQEVESDSPTTELEPPSPKPRRRVLQPPAARR